MKFASKPLCEYFAEYTSNVGEFSPNLEQLPLPNTHNRKEKKEKRLNQKKKNLKKKRRVGAGSRGKKQNKREG